MPLDVTTYIGPDNAGNSLESDAAAALKAALEALNAGMFTAVNRVINGGFQVNQRLASSCADDTFCLDRFFVLTQTGAVAVTQLVAPENGAAYGIRLTQSQASAQRMGLGTILEGRDCKDLRAQITSFLTRARLSTSANLRFAVLEWTGTEDSVTSDVVLDWTSASYTAGGFFLASNVTVLSVGVAAAAANTWRDLELAGLTQGTTFNNIILFVWTEATVAQNVTLDFNRWRWGAGAKSAPFTPRSFEEELLLCLRYYQKSFPLATAPAQNAGYAGAIVFPSLGASTDHRYALRPVVPMRALPVRTYFNPSAANAQAYDIDAAASCTNTSTLAFGPSAEGGAIFFTTPAGSAIGRAIFVHVVLEAEL